MKKIGIACGRFQIFHNEHLAYVMGACDKCDHLIVGSTAPDPEASPVEAEDPNRTEDVANSPKSPKTSGESHRFGDFTKIPE